MNSQQAHCHRFKGHTSPLPRPQQREHGLVAPQYAAVAASRAALQAYLDGPQFATAAAAVARPSHAVGYAPGTSSQQLPNNPEPQAAVRTWQDQKQQQQQEQRWWHEAAVGSALGREGTDSRSRSSSSPPWRRGILVVAGGRKLLTHLVVQLKVLRETLGCSLPVEVAWQGPKEMDNVTLAALQHRFGPLRGFDVQAMPYPPEMRRVPLTRWVGKVAALLHCSLQEVLLLDSDNLPLVDPAYLFDDPLYQQHGNLFWPDFWGSWVKPGVYLWLGLNRTVVQPQIHAGAGFTGRDAESGMVLLDRQRWLKVLYWTFWINTWHQQLYYHVIHGDKDTFALAFALAGQADEYRQVSVVPGGVFRWGKGQLEVKAMGASSASTADGWQLLGALQYDDTGRPVFFHRTMNKFSPDEEPWPAELVTGPLTSRWLEFYLAHDSKGPTKGVWWEHVAPASAFAIIPQPNSTQHIQQFGNIGPSSSIYSSSATSSSSGVHGCPIQLFLFYQAAQQAGLPVDHKPDLQCLCSPLMQVQQKKVAAETTSQVEVMRAVEAPGAPITAALVTPVLTELSGAMRVIDASVEALRWLKSEEGQTAFPSLAPGSSMP